MLFRSIYTRFIFVKNNIKVENIAPSRHLQAIFVLVSALVLLSACASAPGSKLSETRLGETRNYSTPNNSIFLPGSEEDMIPDADILYLDGDVTAMLDETVLTIAGPRLRLNAIIELLNKKIQWKTESDSYTTKTAMETYQTGTGNCLSFANLFIAMARYAGLEAGYQEVSTGLNWNREGGVLFVSKHISATTTIDDVYKSDVELVYTDDNVVKIKTSNSGDTIPAQSETLLVLEQKDVQAKPIPDYRAFAQYYNNIASMHLAEGNYDLALKYFFKSIKTDSSLEFVWSNLGVAYSRNHQWAAAEAVYFMALSTARDTDEIAVLSIINNMVKLYERTGDKEKADFYRAKVTRLRENNPYYHYLAGQNAFSDTSYEQSVEYFKAAIERKDDEDLFYYSLAMAYLKLGELKKAVENIDKAGCYAWGNQKKAYYAQVQEEISGIAMN